MKVAALTALESVEVQERPVPAPGRGEVLLKVAAVGVCGSDVHYYHEGRIGDFMVQYPILLGHEASAVVEAPGEGVELARGARVAVEPAASCMKCEHCLAGRHNICPNVRFLGTPPIDGIFAQYAVMPERCCIPVPDELSLVEAAMLEPLGIGLHAVKLARITPGETAAVFGAGPIGLVTMLAARAAGASKVYMTDLVPERLAFAREHGADAVMNADEGDVVEWIMDLTGGRGVDAAFEAAGVQDTVTHACQAARIGGRVYIVGIPEEDALLYPTHTCRRRELVMQHVRRSNGEAAECLDLVASGRINLKPLATHRFRLDQVQEAMELVRNYADGVIRAVILPNPDLAEG